MITFDRLWEMMEKKGMTQYALINHYGFSGAVIYALRHNKNVTAATLCKLCTILDCKLSDIAEDSNHPE